MNIILLRFGFMKMLTSEISFSRVASLRSCEENLAYYLFLKVQKNNCLDGKMKVSAINLLNQIFYSAPAKT
jgi:hypothetical protein